MGKQGPCCHCGISITPLWRNGPADKPVLCNACGSRWRTKGTLVNYMPMHSGGLGEKTKKSTQNVCDQHSRKRKEMSDDDFIYSSPVMLEEEISTRSSTESRISFSESCAQHALAASRALDFWPPWGSHSPSKKRTVMNRRPHPANVRPGFLLSSIPFQHKMSSEDDLLVEYRPSSMTTEIGLGGMLFQPILPTITAQESQASSLLCDNKELHHSATLSNPFREKSLDVHVWDQSTTPRVREKTKWSARSISAIDKGSAIPSVPNKTLLDSFPYSKHDVLQSCHSPLNFVELKDIINLEQYESLLSKQEQQQLVRHLSSADTVADSLRCMFSSAQFENALRGFQVLLSEGMFDSLASRASPGVLQHYRQLLTLSNLTTSGWMESCSRLLCRGRHDSPTKYVKIMQGKEDSTETRSSMNSWSANVVSSSINLMASKKPTGSVTAERAIKRDYAQHGPAAVRQKHSAKCASVEQRQQNRPKSKAKNAHLQSKGMRGSANYGMLIEAPFFGVLDHEILLDLPPSLSFQQAELLQKPVHSEMPSQEAGIVIDTSGESRRPNDTHSQNI